MKKPQFFITMSGQSSRFKSAGYLKPKALLPIGDKAIVEHLITQLKPYGDVFVIVNEADWNNKDYNLETLIRNAGASPVKIQVHHKGPSWSMHLADEYISDDAPVFIHYCDVGGNWNIEKSIIELEDVDAVLLGFTGFHPHMLRSKKFGYAQIDSKGKVVGIQEKKSYTDTPELEFASGGIYGFKNGKILRKALKAQFENNLQHSGEFYSSLTLIPLIDEGLSISAQLMTKFFNWGTPEDYEDFIYYFNNFEFFRSYLSFPIKTCAILLAGGGSSRLVGDGEVAKQFLQVQEKSLWKHALDFVEAKNPLLVARKVLLDKFSIDTEVATFGLLSESRSGVDTAFWGLSRFMSLATDLELSGPISFLCTDNLLSAGADGVNSYDKLIETSDLVVWTAANYPRAMMDPTSFSWVKVDDDMNITEFRIKGNPQEKREWQVVTGNFTFKDSKVGYQILGKAMELVDANLHEIHLESIIDISINLGYKVVALNLDFFVSVGTFDEYRIATYYDSIFNESTYLLDRKSVS